MSPVERDLSRAKRSRDLERERPWETPAPTWTFNNSGFMRLRKVTLQFADDGLRSNHKKDIKRINNVIFVGWAPPFGCHIWILFWVLMACTVRCRPGPPEFNSPGPRVPLSRDFWPWLHRKPPAALGEPCPFRCEFGEP